MTKNFDTNQYGVVIGTVTTVPCSDYFFVQNGDPKQIFCHRNQGGDLKVSACGRLVLEQNRQVLPPTVGDKIVLIRESGDSLSKGFSKAARWTGWVDWQEFGWAVNAGTTYRITAWDHRSNGHFAKGSNNSVELVCDTLLNIMRQYPKGVSNDPLSEGYTTRVGSLKLSYEKILWERLDADGVWTECGDPRPAGKF